MCDDHCDVFYPSIYLPKAWFRHHRSLGTAWLDQRLHPWKTGTMSHVSTASTPWFIDTRTGWTQVTTGGVSHHLEPAIFHQSLAINNQLENCSDQLFTHLFTTGMVTTTGHHPQCFNEKKRKKSGLKLQLRCQSNKAWSVAGIHNSSRWRAIERAVLMQVGRPGTSAEFHRWRPPLGWSSWRIPLSTPIHITNQLSDQLDEMTAGWIAAALGCR